MVGNQKAVKLLDRILAAGKIANAYLFVGPKSVGKFTAAVEFAKRIIESSPMNSSGQENFDLIIIKPEIEEKKGVVRELDIKIEDIRNLQHKLSLTSAGGKFKAVIIDGAEKLNQAAQNALLKTLEEPNDQVVLILIAQNERKILPTISSRCQKIRFGLVQDNEIRENFSSSGVDDHDLISWSLGRPGFASDLVNNPAKLTYYHEVLSELRDVFVKNMSEKFYLAETLTKDLDELQKKLELWMVILRRGMLGEKSTIAICPSMALKLIEEISESLQLLRETNSNPKLIMENLFLKFQK